MTRQAKFRDDGTSSARRKPEINSKMIQEELKELAEGERVKVSIDRNQVTAISIRESERRSHYSFTVTLNPKRIRTQKQLDGHLEFARQQVAGANGIHLY